MKENEDSRCSLMKSLITSRPCRVSCCTGRDQWQWSNVKNMSEGLAARAERTGTLGLLPPPTQMDVTLFVGRVSSAMLRKNFKRSGGKQPTTLAHNLGGFPFPTPHHLSLSWEITELLKSLSSASMDLTTLAMACLFLERF